METTTAIWMMAAIGLCAGIGSGVFGIGGGVVIVPALVCLAGFTQHRATGTSLAVLLPPVGIAAVFEYSRHGQVDWRAALVIALMMCIGAYVGAYFANKAGEAQLKLLFGIFLMALSLYMISNALTCRKQTKLASIASVNSTSHPLNPT